MSNYRVSNRIFIKIPKVICSVSAVLFSIFALQSPANCQVLYGSMVGTATDPSGAVIPGATVTATSTGTGQTRSDTTDANGRYNLTNLLPGSYKLSVVAKGFQTLQQAGITITPNTLQRVDVQLQVGAATQQVNVSAEAVQLQTDKADTHTEITSKAVVDMPLGGNRNYQTLINLAPGTAPSSFYNSQTDVPARPLNTHVNGAAGQTNITKIDGAESINVWLPQYTGYVAPAETVDVVNITTSAADADQGLAGASSITLVTKSGTNNLHGSAFIFHNDQHLNARNYFLQPGTDKPVGIYNNYGATLGGPIKKDKLFYFVSFDGTTQKTSANGLYTVPTADQRAGDFSAYDTPIYNPFPLSGNADGTGRSLFAGGKIPTSLVSPQALAIQSYFPAPNLPGTVNNYAAAASPAVNRFQYDAKVNWNRTDKHTIFVKYDNMFATSGGVGIFGDAGGPAPGSDPGSGRTSVQVASIGHTYVFSPTLVLDGNVGYQRMNQDVLGTDFGKNYSSTLGIPGLNGPDIRDSGFPDISFGSSFYSSGADGLTFGVPSWMPLYRTDETYTTNHSLAWTKGAHEVRFGFDMVRHHLNHWQPELSPGGPRGLFDFNGSITTSNSPTAPAANQFNSYAQFLLGLSDNTQKGEQYILMTGREWQFGWFVQDRWQVSKKLTVSAGLRYELYPLMTRCCGKGIERYDPTTNDVYMGGRGDIPEDAGISVSHKLFAPRVGIAYRIDEKTVVRAGYGLNFDPLAYSRPLRGFYPLTINNNYTAANSFSVANLGNANTFVPATLANGIPPVVGPDLSTGIVPLDPTASERSPNSFIHRGYVQSWNFTLERQLPGQVVLSAGYVAQHTVHQLADYDINTGFPGSGTALLPQANIGRTVPTDMWDGYLSSEYNSLQVSFNKQFSNGLMLKGAYTWSHAIDYADDDGWQGVDWYYAPDFQRNRASAGFDHRHVFTLGWVYELPFGPGKKYVSTGIASKILGGWQFSGIENCYTGAPMYIYASGTSLNAPDNTQTANQVMTSVPFIGGAGPGAFYYNPAAFAPVTTQTFGNTGRNTLAGPGVWNTDMSISRTFPIRENLKFEFRTEFYNLPNTSHFNAPDNTVNDSNFMQITSSFGERNIRFAGRFSW